jgi:hypothetical protein
MDGNLATWQPIAVAAKLGTTSKLGVEPGGGLQAAVRAS